MPKKAELVAHTHPVPPVLAEDWLSVPGESVPPPHAVVVDEEPVDTTIPPEPVEEPDEQEVPTPA